MQSKIFQYMQEQYWIINNLTINYETKCTNFIYRVHNQNHMLAVMHVSNLTEQTISFIRFVKRFVYIVIISKIIECITNTELFTIHFPIITTYMNC